MPPKEGSSGLDHETKPSSLPMPSKKKPLTFGKQFKRAKYYGKIAKNLYLKQNHLEKASPLFDFASLAAKRIQTLAHELKGELEPLYSEDRLQHGQKQIEAFLNHFSCFMHHLGKLIKPTEEDIGRIDVSDAVDKLLTEVSTLSDEFEFLNLKTMLDQYIPPNFDQLKDRMLKKISDSMRGWLVRIEKEATLIDATIWKMISPETFASLPRIAQYSLLISIETALTSYKEFILILDSIELQLGFRENALLTILMNEKKSENSPKNHSLRAVDYTRSVLIRFQKLSANYQKLIKHAKYVPIETFPYRHSKIDARIKLTDKLKLSLEEKQNNYQNLDKDLRTRALASLIDEQKAFFKDLPKIDLPASIKTVKEASQWQEAVFKNYQQLKELLSTRPENQVPQLDPKVILLPHQTALTIIRELGFYLQEKERIDVLCQRSAVPESIPKHRDFKITDTLKMSMDQSARLFEKVQPFLKKGTKERVSLETRLKQQKQWVLEARGFIEETFDPIFIQDIRAQFLREEAEQKVLNEQIWLEKKADSPSLPPSQASSLLSTAVTLQVAPSPLEEKEKKQDASELPSLVNPNIDNPFSYFASKLIISSLRFLKTMDILLAFIEPNKYDDSSETSPSEALKTDMEKSGQILEHIENTWTYYHEFQTWLQPALISNSIGSAKKNGEEKTEIPQEMNQGNHLLQEIKEQRTVSEKGSVDNCSMNPKTLSFLSKLQAIVQAKIEMALKPFELYFNEALQTIEGLISDISPDDKHEDRSFQIGGVTVNVKNEIGQLIQSIARDIRAISTVFIHSYADYMWPPTRSTHIQTILGHAELLMRLAQNVDKLLDIIKVNQFPAKLQFAYHMAQLFKKIFVLVDEIEIRLHLREGSILKCVKLCLSAERKTQLEAYFDIIKTYLRENALEFPKEDCPPFALAVTKNRQDLLVKVKDKVSLAMISDRLGQFNAEEKEPNKVNDVDKPVSVRASAGSSFIPNFWSSQFKPSDKNTAQDLLIRKLIEGESGHKETNDFLNDIDTLAENDPQACLLFEGEIGARLNGLCNKKSILTVLELEIDGLLARRHHWFVWSRNQLERRISLLQTFRHFLKIKGYNIQRASEALNPEWWAALLKTDRPLFEKLQIMEAQIPADQRECTQISLSKKDSVKPDPMLLSKIDTRVHELDNKFYKSRIVCTKQKLLTALKREMDAGKSFKKALREVKNRNPEDCHLLHEGETGKMIADIVLAKPKQRQAYLDRQIQALRGKYFESPGFFSRKSSIIRQAAKDIHLLKEVKTGYELLPAQQERLNTIAPEALRPMQAKGGP